MEAKNAGEVKWNTLSLSEVIWNTVQAVVMWFGRPESREVKWNTTSPGEVIWKIFHNNIMFLCWNPILKWREIECSDLTVVPIRLKTQLRNSGLNLRGRFDCQTSSKINCRTDPSRNTSIMVVRLTHLTWDASSYLRNWLKYIEEIPHYDNNW